MYYLYIKTHNVTKLKYLGMTIQNPFTYYGSGKYWLRHLRIHGYDVTTEIIFKTENYEEFQEKCLYHSKLYDVVNSKEWANLIEETGIGSKGWIPSQEYRDNVSKRMKGNTFAKGNKGKPKSEEMKIKSSLSQKNKSNIGSPPNKTSFKKGQIPWNKGKKQIQKWFNNGITEILVSPNKKPENFILGRLKRRI